MVLFQAFTSRMGVLGCDKVRHMALQEGKIACSCHARGCSGVRDFRTGEGWWSADGRNGGGCETGFLFLPGVGVKVMQTYGGAVSKSKGCRLLGRVNAQTYHQKQGGNLHFCRAIASRKKMW